MIKGIIFDMDGVMIDSERQSNYGWLKAAEEQGIQMPMWLINIFKGAPAVISKQHFDDYFHGQADYWETRKLRSKYVHKLRETEGIPVKKGLYELLEYSRNTGIKCAVATSTQKESAYKTLHLIGVWEYLSAVVFGDEVKNGKPAPDIFLKAAMDLGLEPSECIVIEDSINGIKAGYNAKIRVVHVPDTIIIEDDIRNLTSEVCDDLNEVINVIERWNTADAADSVVDADDTNYIDGTGIANCMGSPVYERSGRRLDRCALKYAFISYAAPYNIQDDKIRLKIEHTYRVAGLCEQIAKSLGLSDADIDMAWFLGMFHDIGRFEQVKQYNTFDDSRSTDHAALSADITFVREELPQVKEAFSYIDTQTAELAIRNHNVYRLPETLSAREKMFCDILRDADKIDILKVCAKEPVEAVYAVTEEELYNCCISDEVLDTFCNEKTILKSMRKTAADKLVGHISLVYELVYPESLRIAKSQGYLDILLNFSSNNQKAQEQFTLVRAKMQEYLRFIVYDSLPKEAEQIRKEVFIKEQEFKNEFDEIDNTANHIVMFDGDEAVATCRFFWKDEEQCYYIGRVAVIRQCRGKGFGGEILRYAEKCIKKLGGRKVRLSGQVRAALFYTKMGYCSFGEEYLDEGCTHVMFEKELN